MAWWKRKIASTLFAEPPSVSGGVRLYVCAAASASNVTPPPPHTHIPPLLPRPLMQARFDEALDAFELAERIDPGFWKMNRVMLGKTNAKLNNKDAAKAHLEVRGRGLPSPLTASAGSSR